MILSMNLSASKNLHKVDFPKALLKPKEICWLEPFLFVRSINYSYSRGTDSKSVSRLEIRQADVKFFGDRYQRPEQISH